MKSEPKRSPLDRNMPLRVAGQSVHEDIDKAIHDDFLSYYFFAGMLTLTAAMEWVRYFNKSTPSPKLFTTLALISIAAMVWKLLKTKKQIKLLKLGRDGERVVAHYLEELRSYGFAVFHDVQTGDANVDHIIIGTKGVFTIETKALQKPLRGQCKVSVANGIVYANGAELPRNPLTQAKAQANWLKNFLAESKFNIKVWPILAIPGWFVEPFNYLLEGAWVLEPKLLQMNIERQPERHTPEQVSAMVSALRSYIRSQIKE